MADSIPKIHVSISLTSPTFRISDSDDAKPHLVVTSTLLTGGPATLTVDSIGERDAGTVLSTFGEPWFRVENFAFYDLSTSPPQEVVQDFFPGSCTPDDHYFLELKAGEPRVTSTLLHGVDPLSDPVNLLKPGHSYRVTLKPQMVRCWAVRIEKMLARKEIVMPTEGEEGVEVPPGCMDCRLSEGGEVRLACEDRLILRVEE